MDCVLFLGSPVTILHNLHWRQPWWYRMTLYQQHHHLRYAFWNDLQATGRWDHPWIWTGLHHRSSLWPSARQSTQRPEREYWEAPAQRRHLRTNPTLTGNHRYWQFRGFTCIPHCWVLFIGVFHILLYTVPSYTLFQNIYFKFTKFKNNRIKYRRSTDLHDLSVGAFWKHSESSAQSLWLCT